MKTLLIRPSLCKENVVPFMPLNIFVLGSYIKKACDVVIWDFPTKYGIPLTNENYLRIFERFKDDVISEEPDVVGISCTSGDEYIPTQRIARATKEVLPLTTVVVGGYHASACGEEMLRESKDIDCIVVGEGEEPLRKIVQNRIDKKKILQDIPGILVFKGNAMFRTESVYTDINELPFLDIELMEFARVYPIMAVELSRGCPFKCNFCQESLIKGRRWRVKNPKRAVEELGYLRENSGRDNFFFHDSLFGANENWMTKVCRGVSERNIDINWFAMVRAAFKEETLQMMSKAGSYSLFFGLESGSQEVLRLIDKIPGAKDYTQYLKTAERVFVNSAKCGILPVIGVIVGYPGENLRTMRETASYLENVARKCKKVSDAGFDVDPMFYLPTPKTRTVELLGFYEKEFGTKVIINSEWWKQDFPFINYFRAVSVIPSKGVSLKDLEKQRRTLTSMKYLTEKSYNSSFWGCCQTREVRKLRKKMMKGDNFPAKDFLGIVSEKWKNQRTQPYKVPITERISKELSRWFHDV